MWIKDVYEPEDVGVVHIIHTPVDNVHNRK